MEARTAGECSRTRGGLTLPTSSDSGIEQNNTQDAGMLPVGKVHDMSNIIRSNDSTNNNKSAEIEIEQIFQLKSRGDAKKLFRILSKQQKNELLLGLLFALADRTLQRVGNG